MKNFSRYIILFLVSTVLQVQAMDLKDQDRLTAQRNMPTYSERVTKLLHSLNGEDIDLSKCNLAPRQQTILKSKTLKKELYSLAGDFCYQNHNLQLATHFYAKASLLGNFNSLFELAGLLQDQQAKQLLIEEAADHNCYRAQVFLGRIKEVY